MNYSFRNGVGVVTGGTSGIGLEIVKKLLAQGMKVYALGRNFKLLEDQLKAVESGFNCEFVSLDMNKPAQIEENLAVLKKERRIEMLIHCAGVIELSPHQGSHLSDLDEQYRINLRAPYQITQLLLPMLKKGPGQIHFLNSTAGLRSWKGIGQYSATKFGLKAVADSLREELKGHKIKVTSMYLGSVDTPMQEKVQRSRGNKYLGENYMNPSEIAKFVIQILSLPQDIGVEDITITSV